MTVMARFRAPNWTLNSNDSSPHSSLPLISLRGALARAFGYSSVLDLGPFYFKLRVDALFSCSQALNRADFEAEQQNPANFEPPTSNAIPDFKSTGKLRVDALSSCSQALKSSCRLPIPPRTSNIEFRAVNIEFSPLNFKSSGKLLVDDLSDCSQLRIPSCNFTANFESSRQLRIQSLRTSNQASFD